MNQTQSAMDVITIVEKRSNCIAWIAYHCGYRAVYTRYARLSACVYMMKAMNDKECLYFGATRPSRPSKLFKCDGSRVEPCTNSGRDVVVGVCCRDATSRSDVVPCLYFFS
ncbi:hypothetical protein Y032_0503g2636 [Ancylostoma ceylanicum]|uniref:Uncharacterized protein n=1 Tax=Ancylostoma ceylanicum TaxID=53326 RepID=A0A016WVS3_9BILA|nr:hypothetical protein Y032_0503g2636 [Ancylostoma ceylanicum]